MKQKWLRDGAKLARRCAGGKGVLAVAGRLVGCLLSGVRYQGGGLFRLLVGRICLCRDAAVALKLPREVLHAEKLAVAREGSDGGD